MLNGDAGTKSLNIPHHGFKFDLRGFDDQQLKLQKNVHSDSDSADSQDIELLFPHDQVFQNNSPEPKKET